MKKITLLLIITFLILFLIIPVTGFAEWKPDFKYIKIHGAVPGSSWYTYAVKMGLEIEKKYPGIKASALSSNVANCIVGVNGDYRQFGIAFMNGIVDAWFGKGSIFKGKEYRNMRYIGPFVSQRLNVLVRNGAEVRDGHFNEDIKKLRFSVGARNWVTKTFNVAGLEALGINEKSVREMGGSIRYVGYGDMKTMLKDRNLDAAIVLQTMPSGIFASVANTPPGIYMPRLSKEELTKFVKGQPERIREIIFQSSIPDNYMGGNRKGGPTVAITASLIAHKDLPAEMVYQIAKLSYESPTVKAACGPVKDCLVARNPLQGKPEKLPMHPGAVKYWKEKGLLN